MQPLLSGWREPVVLAAVLSAMLSGCGSTQMVTVGAGDVALPKPVLAPLPVSVGIYHAPALRDAHNTDELNGTAYDFAIGAGAVAAFDAIAAAMFRSPVQLQQRPASGADGLDGVIELRAVRASMNPTGAQVSYDLLLYRKDGVQEASWLATGRGPVEAEPAAAVRSAIRDAAAAFAVKFAEQKEVREWLEGLGLIPSLRPPFAAGGAP